MKRPVVSLTSLPASLHARRRRGRVLAALGAVLLACPVHGAAAQTFPLPGQPVPASFVGFVSFNFLDPAPLNVTTFGFGRVLGRLRYEAMSLGPDGTVPISVFAHGVVKGNVEDDPPSPGSYSLRASWSITGPSVSFAEGLVPPMGSGNFFDRFDHVVGFNMIANRAYTVELFADIGIANGVTNGARGGGYAYIDPVFSFDPGVGPEYSFVFSEGVGNAPISSVPEPSTFALLAAGLLTVSVPRTRARRMADQRGDRRSARYLAASSGRAALS
jgi:hypothetical protein